MKFTLWFEIYGKKMKCEIEANTEAQAEYFLRGKIKVHKIQKSDDNQPPDFLTDIFSGFGKKK